MTILPRRSSNPNRSRWALPILLVILAASALIPQSLFAVDACTLERSGCGFVDAACGGSPARPVPQVGTDGTRYWSSNSSLQPVDVGPLPANRDATSFYDERMNYFDPRFQWYFNLDTQNGYIFMAMAFGLQIWDARTNPASPTLLGSAPFTVFPVWNTSAEVKWPLQAVSLPPGDDTIAAVAGLGGIGMALFDLSDKANPKLIYQSSRKDGFQVHVSKIGTSQYAFMAAGAGDPSGGLYMYNVTQARANFQANHGLCAESFPAVGEPQACPGVYMGRLGTTSPSFVDGIDQFVVASSGAGNGFQIWDASNPQSPRLALTGLKETPVCPGGFDNRAVYGVAMWKDSAGRYLLGLRTEKYDCSASLTRHETRIYDVSCITGTCGALGSPLYNQEFDSGTSNTYATFSRSGNTPFLYLGSDNRCGLPTPQREWLLDVTNPSAPVEITRTNQSVPSNYWGWYYKSNPTGYNFVMPRSGKFIGDYFYRTALSIFDIHKRFSASAPTADFSYSPTEIYPGTPVSFTDASTGNPSSWSWTFPGGSPSTASSSAASTTFSASGSKAVTLSVANGIGSAQTTKNVVVLDPTPHVAGVGVSPASPSVCQPVTLTASGVTGKPPLAYAWTVKNDSTNLPATTGSGSSFVWNSGTAFSGAYTATVTVSNASGSESHDGHFTLAPLAALPTSSFTPTNDPYTSATVQFHLAAAGATEWNWNFGDGNSTGWINDPVAGPNPVHIYASKNTFTVSVQIRNCVEAAKTSNTLSIPITVLTPLTASFSPVCQFNPCSFAVGQSINFTDSSTGAEHYDWDWDGDGTFEDVDHAPSNGVIAHTYPTAGTYSPRLRVRRGASEQALSPATITLFVGGTVTPATITVSGTSSGTPGTSYTYSAFGSNCTPVSTWNWSVGDGTIAGSSTGSTITVSWATAGSKFITATNGGCAAQGSLSVFISTGGGGGGGGATLASIFNYSPTSPAANTPVQFDGTASGGSPTGYSWDFGDNSTGVGNTTSHTYATGGTYTVKLTVSKSGGTGAGCQLGICFADSTKTVTVGGGGGSTTLAAHFSLNPTAPKVGDTVAFDGGASTGSPTGYTWDFGDGSTANGATATHSFATSGNYLVKLSVFKAGTGAGCQLGTCFSDSTVTLFVAPTSAPTLDGDFTPSVSCSSQFGFTECDSSTGVSVSLTANAAGATSYAWNFGDSTTGTGRTVSHTWYQPGSYTVALTVTSGQSTATKTRTFVITGPVVAQAKSVLLPWIAQTRGALVQSSDLYLHNPGSAPMDVTVQFRKRGTPENPPPQVTKTIQPGATLYVPDVLGGLFSRENVAGFITVVAKNGGVEPIVTSFNTIFQTNGAQFGQSVSGQSMNPAGNNSTTQLSDPVQHLVGLSDNPEKLAYFGISNPNGDSATYHLRFFNNLGQLIGQSQGDLPVASFGQRQYQVSEIRNLFGINDTDDYRIEVESKSGGQIYPYASNLRLASGDPSFIEAAAGAPSKVYLVGTYSTANLGQTTWQSDIVLTNTSDQVVHTSMIYTQIGVSSQPTKPVALTLQPGETRRLVNAIASQFKVSNTVGVVTFQTDGTGPFPIIQGESYDNGNPAKRFGQSMMAQVDADAASAGQGHYLVGLRQDGDYRTNYWVFNPSTEAGDYDIVYRNLDGVTIGTLHMQLSPGKMRQVGPTQHPIPAAGVTGGFTVQIMVHNGKALSAAQVVNNDTNDPAYIQGAVR